jgi:hypothetical protein
MDRRTALQALGATLASAGLPGCGSSLILPEAVSGPVVASGGILRTGKLGLTTKEVLQYASVCELGGNRESHDYRSGWGWEEAAALLVISGMLSAIGNFRCTAHPYATFLIEDPVWRVVGIEEVNDLIRVHTGGAVREYHYLSIGDKYGY